MNKIKHGIFEFFRKRVVALKRKPHLIPLLVMGAAYVYYSLNLSNIARTTSDINGKYMGLSEFTAMLLGVLLLVCFMNAFPHRKKVNLPMLGLMLALTAVVIYCDTYYRGRITYALTREENRIVATSTINAALKAMDVHRILLGVGVLLTALLPVYAPLIKKIRTSVRIEDNGAMGAIDISGEDA